MKKLLRKRLLFLVALLVGLGMPAMAQTTVPTRSTFNVASVPVEGFPQSVRENILFIIPDNTPLKQNALGPEGTKKLSLSMSKQDWSIIGLCEDYNFHTELMTSLGNYNSYSKPSDDYGVNSSSTSDRGDRYWSSGWKYYNNTDGIGILVSKSDYTLGNLVGVGERFTGGSGANAMEYNDGNFDGLVFRGYRSWPVTLPNGAIIDVYVVHLDAGVADGSSDYLSGVDRNTIARENQLSKLANVLKEKVAANKRPAIVMGVTNSLYTREALQTKFINQINSVTSLTINDAWVELIRGGKYPTYGTDAEVPGSLYYNDQNGEVVNKVFYINHSSSDYTIKANSYYRNVENFVELDVAPVVVNFTVVKNGDEDENGDVTVNPDSWVIPESNKPATETPSAVLGEVVTSGTQYFVKNVNSGHFLMAGADWGARACEGSAAMPITITKQGNVGSTYTLATLQNFVFVAENNAERVFMDGGDSNAGNNYWVLEEVSGSKTTINGTSACQYYIYHTTYGALTSTGSGEYGNLVYCTPLNRSNDKQKWVLLTSTNMRKFMSSATVSNPFDITPFMFGGADFGRMLVQKGNASTWGVENDAVNTNFDFWYNHDGSQHNDGFAFNGTYANATIPAITIEKSLSDMPKGKYYMSFEGFYRARAKSGAAGRNTDYVMTIPVTLGNSSVNLFQNNEAEWASKADDWGKGKLNDFLAIFRDGDAYKTEVTTTLTSQGKLNFKFNKPSFSEGYGSDSDSPRRNLVAMDNFSIKYFGNSADNSVKLLVYNYLQQTAAKVALLNSAGQAAYDVSEVIWRYNNNKLSSDGSVEIAMIDAAYEIALRAHNAKEAEDALTNNNGDVTGMIVNPSFEQGATGWIIGNGSDAGVRDNVGAYYVDNAHSDVEGEEASQYQLYNGYNEWGWSFNVEANRDEWARKDGNYTTDVGPVSQTITNLKNGLYELKALVTSFPGNVVYIFGNGSYASAKAQSKEHFEEVTLNFLVEDGTAKIGAIGSFNGYYFTEGCFFKADNFRLKYICDDAHGRVKLALDEAKAVRETFDASGKAYQGLIDVLNEYDVKYNAGTIEKTDGTAEAAEIYNQLEAAALQQKTIGSDMSWCLGDPSFELGKYTADWSRMNAWDAKAASQSDATYSAVGVDGSYLFNAWNPGTDIVPPLTKTITGLPNGTYRLSAMVSSDNGRTVYITGNGKYAGATAQDKLVFVGKNEEGKDMYWKHLAAKNMFPVELEFEVTNGTATIGAVGGSYEDGSYASKGGCWYKVDDFHLKLLLLADNASQDEEQYAWDDVLYLDQDAEYIPVLPRAAGGNTYNYKKVVLDRPVAGGVWNTFVVPFRMDYKNDVNCDLYGWEVKQLTHISLDETGQVVMSFADAPSIEPGVSYMVRKKDLAGTLDVIEEGDGVNSVEVNTTFTTGGSSTHPTTTYTDKSGNITLTITGVYTNGYVPAGSYFINNNKFYQAQYDNKNRLRGYRAYITIKDAQGNARKLSFRIGEGTGVDAANNDEVTVVGIYNLSGMRLTDMEPGVNILQMSDGTTMKVIIK